MAHEKKKVIEREPWNPATTNLEVPVVGCVVQRGVIVQPLGVDFCACSQQLLCHVVVSPVACLVQRRPACKQTDTERWASPSWRGSETEKSKKIHHGCLHQEPAARPCSSGSSAGPAPPSPRGAPRAVRPPARNGTALAKLKAKFWLGNWEAC